MNYLSWNTVDLLIVDSDTTVIPLILCSVADQTYRDRQPKLQALGHTQIEKPFVLNELVGHIRTALTRDERM